MMRRPVMTYMGGKFRIAQWILSHFPPHKIYVEPYGGAASVLLRKPRSTTEVYNDLDERIVNVFRCLQNQESARELERRLRVTPYAYAEWMLAHVRRDIIADHIEAARMTILKSFLSISADGTTRKNIGGFGSRLSQNYTTKANAWASYADMIPVFRDRLMGVIIECRDALQIMTTYDNVDALHYVDPPYVSHTWGSGKSYNKELSDSEHENLLKTLLSLSGMVVLSGYDNELYNDMLQGWTKDSKNAINLLNDRRVECLWISPAAVEKLKESENE